MREYVDISINVVGHVYDVMKYAEAKQINLSFKDGLKEITALVIDNPCEKNSFQKK